MLVKSFIPAAIFLLLSLQQAQATPLPNGVQQEYQDALLLRRKIPLYRIDLDKNPRERWTQVVADFKNATKVATKQFLSVLSPELRFFATVAASKLRILLPDDYTQEIIGIAETVGVPLGDMVLLNVIYDVTAHCTGIIANDRQGGVWHARNLDYGLSRAQTGALQDTTVRVDFVRNGKLAYSAVTFAGYVGVLTAWKPHSFGITINQRNEGSLGRNLMSAALEILRGRRLSPVSFISRQAMEQDPDYASCQRRLMRSELIAPVYYILSGNSTDQGVVIVREQFAVVGLNQLDQAAGKWFLVQTNYDPWNPVPPKDDRRDPAIRAMRAVGQHRVSRAALLSVLSQPPVLNSHTAYSSVFSAAYPNASVTVIRRETATKDDL